MTLSMIPPLSVKTLVNDPVIPRGSDLALPESQENSMRAKRAQVGEGNHERRLRLRLRAA